MPISRIPPGSRAWLLHRRLARAAEPLGGALQIPPIGGVIQTVDELLLGVDAHLAVDVNEGYAQSVGCIAAPNGRN